MRFDDDEPETDDGIADVSLGPLALAVLLPDGVTQTALPDEGEVIMGRSRDCQVRIQHASISRHHAVLRISGGTLTVEDLGSQNGTLVHGQAVLPGKPVRIFVGAVLHLGGVEVRLRRARQGKLPPRLWPHAYLEGRAEEECARARRKNSSFALLRLSAPGAPEGVCEQALAATMRAHDILGRYASGELEVLLIETSPEQAERAAARLHAALEQRGVQARLALACFPRDGNDAEQIFAHASAALRGEPAAEVATYEAQLAAAPTMQEVLAMASTVASSNVSVVILGETGVGKEVCAQLIHDRSPRAQGVFMKLHCAALPDTLIESELFGHERGAFTGAVTAKPGLIESAQGGSVFLDEIGELSLAIQTKLLRVLDAREVLRIGARQPTKVDVRFIAATNRELDDEVAAGRFRQDLYYRLAGVVLHIPPLRERVAEIVLLARRFVDEVSQQLGKPPPILSPAAISELTRYPWPGNIRELRNAMERAVVLAEGRTIEPAQLPFEKFGTLPQPRRAAAPSAAAPAPAAAGDDPEFSGPEVTGRIPRLPALHEEVSALERRRVLDALDAAGGNQSEAARRLGMSRGALLARLRGWGVLRPR